MNASLIKIGEIITPYQSVVDCPNNVSESGPDCTIELLPKYEKGLTGLKIGDKILILYWFDQANRNVSLQKRNGDSEPKGNFALRSPHRPNPIAAATLTIITLTANTLTVRGLDCVSGTSLLDIKPAIKP